MILRFMNLNLVYFGNQIRLSNRYCKFTGEGVFGDTELGDAMFVS